MRPLLAAALIVVTAALPGRASESFGGANAFSFVALGDMPYFLPDDIGRFDRLIGAVNALQPAFTLHMGDIKSSNTPCDDVTYKARLEQLQSFTGPLVYTIGDNEWTDCHRKDAGGHDPRERLARLRQMFFADPARSLGGAPLAVESQARVMPEFSTYVENVRFEKNGVLFLSAHVVGSNNGLEAQDPASAVEFYGRDRANTAWIAAGFAKAVASGAKAVVVFMQADPDLGRLPEGITPRHSGFGATINALEKGAREFGRPVLLIHGDLHDFTLGRLRNNRGAVIPNITKLMVFGEHHVHAVRVLVDPDSAGVFGYAPLIVPENIRK